MFHNLLSTQKLNALLITNKENIGYLTNFWGSFGYVVVTKKTTKLFTDSRYLEEAKKCAFSKIEIFDYKELKKHLKNKKVGFEANHVTVAGIKQWKKLNSQTTFKPITGLIENLRMSKTEDEIKKIKKAAKINDTILKNLQKIIKIGISEKELAWNIQELAYENGADEMAFKSIVNFGKHTAHPHHDPDNTKLKKGDLILIDMGVKYQKYCSDITRVFFTKPPTKKQEEIFQTVLNAQQKAIDKINETNLCKKIDQAARNYIENENYGDYFGHGLGHALGLNIHESPSLSPLSKSKLLEDSIFTIEPGIYLPNQFGIRLEDLFLYKQKKAVQLSKFTKKIEELVLNV